MKKRCAVVLLLLKTYKKNSDFLTSHPLPLDERGLP